MIANLVIKMARRWLPATWSKTSSSWNGHGVMYCPKIFSGYSLLSSSCHSEKCWYAMTFHLFWVLSAQCKLDGRANIKCQSTWIMNQEDFLFRYATSLIIFPESLEWYQAQEVTCCRHHDYFTACMSQSKQTYALEWPSSIQSLFDRTVG